VILIIYHFNNNNFKKQFMKKILFTLALLSAMIVSVNAQVATENSNALDNVGVGVTVGASTPLDFNNFFPLNIGVGAKVTKDFTPVWGVQLDGMAVFNDDHFGNGKGAFDAINLNANVATNLTNVLCGYKGSPRAFEVSAITGIGWVHNCGPKDKVELRNFFIFKSGVDLAFNIGSKKAHSIVVSPQVMWNITRPGNFKLNKHYANLGVAVSYVYHLKTSNGTHHFKLWDVGALTKENEYLQARLDECHGQKPRIVTNVVNRTIVDKVNTEWVVQFEQGSCELTNEAIAKLNSIPKNSVVNVVGTASPEGTQEFNQALSEKRAAVVADYLTHNGVTVNSSTGLGVAIGNSTNRLVTITLVK
jgi:outer membrane protein OmpA-like peptidoglycan-associated protein